MRLIKNIGCCVLAVDIFNVGIGGVYGTMLSDRIMSYIFIPPIVMLIYILAIFCETSAVRYLRHWFDGELTDPLNPL